MKKRIACVGVLAAMTLLSGCETVPDGPTVAVMPAPNKPFEVFRDDEAICRDYAYREIGGAAAGAQQNQEVVQNAVVGTAVGAAAGALIGGGDHHATGVGAGSGLLVGAASGSDRANRSGYGLQRRYDVAYMQCMYAKGNQVPGFAPGAAAPVPPPPPPSR